jgi:hypothetical protein
MSENNQKTTKELLQEYLAKYPFYKEEINALENYEIETAQEILRLLEEDWKNQESLVTHFKDIYTKKELDNIRFHYPELNDIFNENERDEIIQYLKNKKIIVKID